MSVQRVWEAPRVTKPYSDAEWVGIETLAARSMRTSRLRTCGFTMGGEPTFVSIDDPDGANGTPRRRSQQAPAGRGFIYTA